jgi:RNA-directed DNA polymerase
LKVLVLRYYARYTDDFVIVSENEQYLKDILKPITNFLDKELQLSLHPHKVSICKLHNGIDYLGYIVLPHHKLLRTKTKTRIYRGLSRKVREYKNGKVEKETIEQSLHSYLGTLSHANTHKIREDLKNTFWFEINN